MVVKTDSSDVGTGKHIDHDAELCHIGRDVISLFLCGFWDGNYA